MDLDKLKLILSREIDTVSISYYSFLEEYINQRVRNGKYGVIVITDE